MARFKIPTAIPHVIPPILRAKEVSCVKEVKASPVMLTKPLIIPNPPTAILVMELFLTI